MRRRDCTPLMMMSLPLMTAAETGADGNYDEGAAAATADGVDGGAFIRCDEVGAVEASSSIHCCILILGCYIFPAWHALSYNGF